MKRTLIQTACALALTSALMVSTAAQAGVATIVSDHVWNDGQNSVIWGPGIWTKDGQVIGTTFPNGEVQPAGVESHNWDILQLAQEPNDFHFDVEILLPTHAINIAVWVFWDIADPGDIWIEFFTFANTFTSNYDVMLDLSTNTAIVLDIDTQVELYNGDADPFIGNAPLPGDFIGTGSSRYFHVPTPGTLVIALGGLGMIGVGRNRRN